MKNRYILVFLLWLFVIQRLNVLYGSTDVEEDDEESHSDPEKKVIDLRDDSHWPKLVEEDTDEDNSETEMKVSIPKVEDIWADWDTGVYYPKPATPPSSIKTDTLKPSAPKSGSFSKVYTQFVAPQYPHPDLDTRGIEYNPLDHDIDHIARYSHHPLGISKTKKRFFKNSRIFRNEDQVPRRIIYGPKNDKDLRTSSRNIKPEEPEGPVLKTSWSPQKDELETDAILEDNDSDTQKKTRIPKKVKIDSGIVTPQRVKDTVGRGRALKRFDDIQFKETRNNLNKKKKERSSYKKRKEMREKDFKRQAGRDQRKEKIEISKDRNYFKKKEKLLSKVLRKERGKRIDDFDDRRSLKPIKMSFSDQPKAVDTKQASEKEKSTNGPIELSNHEGEESQNDDSNSQVKEDKDDSSDKNRDTSVQKEDPTKQRAVETKSTIESVSVGKEEGVGDEEDDEEEVDEENDEEEVDEENDEEEEETDKEKAGTTKEPHHNQREGAEDGGEDEEEIEPKPQSGATIPELVAEDEEPRGTKKKDEEEE